MIQIFVQAIQMAICTLTVWLNKKLVVYPYNNLPGFYSTRYLVLTLWGISFYLTSGIHWNHVNLLDILPFQRYYLCIFVNYILLQLRLLPNHFTNILCLWKVLEVKTELFCPLVLSLILCSLMSLYCSKYLSFPFNKSFKYLLKCVLCIVFSDFLMPICLLGVAMMRLLICTKEKLSWLKQSVMSHYDTASMYCFYCFLNAQVYCIYTVKFDPGAFTFLHLPLYSHLLLLVNYYTFLHLMFIFARLSALLIVILLHAPIYHIYFLTL